MEDYITEYINGFSNEIAERLSQMRKIIREVVPEAEKRISYGMPTFYLNENLVHFAAMKEHIGFYPTPSGIENFKEKLVDFKYSKGAIQFPFDKPIPFELVAEITRFRVEESKKKAELKALKKKSMKGK